MSVEQPRAVLVESVDLRYALKIAVAAAKPFGDGGAHAIAARNIHMMHRGPEVVFQVENPLALVDITMDAIGFDGDTPGDFDAFITIEEARIILKEWPKSDEINARGGSLRVGDAGITFGNGEVLVPHDGSPLWRSMRSRINVNRYDHNSDLPVALRSEIFTILSPSNIRYNKQVPPMHITTDPDKPRYVRIDAGMVTLHTMNISQI